MRIGTQLKQTIICTGCVGAIFGLMFVLVPVASYYSQRGRLEALGYGPIPWPNYAMDAVIAMAVSAVACVIVFGLLPMALQYGFAWFVRRWTGRA